jgi:hypothetical protein
MCESPSTLLPPSIEFLHNYAAHVVKENNIQTNQTSRKKRNKREESLCFICKDGGQLITCDFPNCPKVYHHVCAGVQNNVTNQTWHCPHHYCYECGLQNKPWVEASTQCGLCPSSSKCKAHGHWSPLSKVSLLLSKTAKQSAEHATAPEEELENNVEEEEEEAEEEEEEEEAEEEEEETLPSVCNAWAMSN